MPQIGAEVNGREGFSDSTSQRIGNVAKDFIKRMVMDT
jgi:hypothetical protein